MKKVQIVFALLLAGFSLKAQTADEIVNKYIENIGGAEKMNALKGLKMTAKVKAPMGEIPVTIIQMKDGNKYEAIEFQGKTIVQTAFDGESAWSHSFMTMKAEKKDSESTENIKRDAGTFPDPFLDYAAKGYKVELLGKETSEGAECFKIKLTLKPILKDGKETENVSYYFFDTEDFVPIAMEKEIQDGPMKGKTSQTLFSDYQEVEGLYFPFSLMQKLKGGDGSTVTMTKVELNPSVEKSVFAFPAGN